MKERALGQGWLRIEKDGMVAEVLRFENGSQYGINGGRISKLWIGEKEEFRVTGVSMSWRCKWLANYDRGWDMQPRGVKAKQFYNKIVKQYN